MIDQDFAAIERDRENPALCFRIGALLSLNAYARMLAHLRVAHERPRCAACAPEHGLDVSGGAVGVNAAARKQREGFDTTAASRSGRSAPSAHEYSRPCNMRQGLLHATSSQATEIIANG
jgi:hypothetical protein